MVQHLAMLCLCHCPCSTPTKGLEVILGYIPLELLAQEMTMRTFLRIQGRNCSLWDGIGRGKQRGHLFLVGSSMPEFFSSDRIPLVMDWDVPEVVIGDGTPMGGELFCYTDGSQIDDGEVGFGFTLVKEADSMTPQNESGNLGYDASVFQGEIFAIQ